MHARGNFDKLKFTCPVVKKGFAAKQQGRLLSAQAPKSFQFFFALGIFDEHAVFGAVEFDNLNFKGKAFVNESSRNQGEHFAIKRNSIWRQISLFDIACGNFAVDEDFFMWTC